MKPMLTLLLLLSSSLASLAQFGDSHVSVTLLSDQQTIQQGKPFQLGVRLVMEDHWHTYWENPGSSGLPPNVALTPIEGLTLSQWQFPVPKKFVDDADYVTFGYDEEALLIAEATYTGDLQSLSLKGKIDWLECKEMCIPGSQEVSLELSVGAAAVTSQSRPLFEKFALQIPKPFDLNAPFSYAGNLTGDTEEWQLSLKMTPQTGSSIALGDVAFFPLAVPDDLAGYVKHTLEAKDDHFLLTATYEAYGDPIPENLTLNGVIALSHVSPAVAYRLPLTASFTAASPGFTATTTAAPAEREFFWRSVMTMDVTQLSLGMVLLIAFLGGLILNIMPCVLPVLSLKVFQVVQEAGDSASHRIAHAWVYTLGILVSFLVLSLFFIVGASMGHQMGMGFQFESPVFVIFMAALIFTMSLSFFGVFQILAPNSSKINNLTQRGGLQGAFFHGAFMTVLSTPCTAPGLGPIYGWVLSQDALTILLVFQVVGFGLAFPYLVLCHSPALMRFLPKPGAWMEQVKVAMGFLLCGTVIWLIGVLNTLTGPTGVTGLLTLLLGLSGATYIYGKIQFGSRRTFGFVNMAVVLLVTGYIGMFSIFDVRNPTAAKTEADNFVRLSVQAELEQGGGSDFFKTLESQRTTAEKIAWIPYSKQSLDYFRSQDRIVFLDFTAEWCITCKANEKLFINTHKVRQYFADNDVVTIKVDYTDMSEEITQKLRSFNRAGVPLYVFYPGENDALVLPEAINQSMLIDAVGEAKALLSSKTAQNLSPLN